MSCIKFMIVLSGLVAGLSGYAFAAKPVGQGPVPSSEVKSLHPSTSAAAIEASALRAGVISKLAKDRHEAVIEGKSFIIQPSQTRVFRNGFEVGASALREGAKVQFNLLSTDASHSTLGVVYVR